MGITAFELFRCCFGIRSLKNVRAGVTRDGVYILRVIYRFDANPHGEQIIWFLYDRKGHDRINEILREVEEKLAEWNGRTLLIEIDNEDSISLPIDVALLSDGCGVIHYAFPIELETGEKGFVGAIVGQGRALNLDEPEMTGVIHAVLANFFGAFFKELAENDPFIVAGLRKLELIKDVLGRQGVRVKPVKIGRGGIVKVE